jgi:hypothetical protein
MMQKGMMKKNGKAPVNLKPSDFQNKERSNWFGLFSAYTNRFL